MNTLQQVVSLSDSFDPESLMGAGNIHVGDALEALKKLRLELETHELLKPALNAMLSSFTGFEPHILVRLKRFLAYIFKARDDPKAEAFRKLDCTSIKICGLCLTQKTLRDLKSEHLDMLIQRAEAASRHLLYVISSNDDIDKVVRLCNVESEEYEQFLSDHKKARRLGKGSAQLNVQYSLAGKPSWCFTGVSQKAVHTSFAIPTSRAIRDITTFLPVDESFDCIVRMTVGFDTELLATLFGHQVPQPIAAEPFSLERAVRSQIEVAFGNIVLGGITASHAWTKEIQEGFEIETSCVKAHIYPSSCLIVTLNIGWRECLQIVQMLYR